MMKNLLYFSKKIALFSPILGFLMMIFNEKWVENEVFCGDLNKLFAFAMYHCSVLVFLIIIFVNEILM